MLHTYPNISFCASKIYHSLFLWRDPSPGPGGLDPRAPKWFDVVSSFGIAKSAKTWELQHNGDSTGDESESQEPLKVGLFPIVVTNIMANPLGKNCFVSRLAFHC